VDRAAKKLGLALIVALGLSALPATVAHAVPEFRAIETIGAGAGHGEASPAHAVVSGETSQAHVLSPSSTMGEGFLVDCATSTFSATMEETISPQLTVSISLDNCTSPTSIAADVRANGCDFLYKVASKVEAGLFKGTLDIACPSGKSIEIETTAMGGVRRCLDTVPAQKGIGPIYYKNMAGAPTDLTVIEEADNVTNITDNGLFACDIIVIGHHANGTLFGETTVRASLKGGGALDFDVAG
jgi:hypothetical protein